MTKAKAKKAPAKKAKTKIEEEGVFTVAYEVTEQSILLATVAPDTVAILMVEMGSYMIVGPTVKALGPLSDEIEDAPEYHDRVMGCYNHYLAEEQNGGLMQ